ncbi:sensor histidine kinase [Desulfogranum mediterraneum]|uniref:sensor histidine kinase n=1 Tax=Desulfogranum mediterraneum TaxID=160661 RepID=UPI00041816E3|nr:PAS domain-containing sensor histidine kinase [Desulfogranum mediterraneum]
MRHNRMKRQFSWLVKILPLFRDNIEGGVVIEKNYQEFARSLFVLLLVLVLIPLFSISILSHYQYKRLLQTNELTQLVLNIEQAKSTMERFSSKLQSIIKFVGHADRYRELIEPEKLEALFVRLRNEYPDFADIEVINSQGKQQAYIGPYTLERRDYTDQTWYREVLQRGLYISTVFSGNRQVPHFVIAISRQHNDRPGTWVLRVTIDGRTLQRYIDTISTPLVDDVYLEDASGIAQTLPRKYGQQGKRSPLGEPLSSGYDLAKMMAEDDQLLQGKTRITVGSTESGARVLLATMPLDNTPWNLVMIKESYMHREAWFFFQLRLFSIISSCMVGAVLVTLRLSKGITAYIRECDVKREHFLAEAENANKLASIGRLAAGVAHEINNPLSIINQKTGLVHDYFEMSGPFEYKEPMLQALDGIQDSVVRCKTITHRLLGFARHTDVSVEQIDINNVLEEVVAFLAREATYNQIRMVFDLDPDIKKIFSDRGQLQQVFLNIINNAVDAIGSNGTITLGSLEQDEQHIRVTIRDTGEGMSEETIRHIFDPFFTTKETGKGTGLGLSITYGIVEKLGGRINVQSEVGQGTSFEIILPVQHDQEQ